MLFRAFRYSKRAVQKPWLTRKLVRERGYSFTSDYVSRHLINRKGLLEKYRDQANVRMLGNRQLRGTVGGLVPGEHPDASHGRHRLRRPFYAFAI